MYSEQKWPQVVTSLVSFSRQYTETSQLDSTDGNRLEDNLESSEQRLFWHEDSKPGTLVWTAVGPLDQAPHSHTSVPCKICSFSQKASYLALETWRHQRSKSGLTLPQKWNTKPHKAPEWQPAFQNPGTKLTEQSQTTLNHCQERTQPLSIASTF